MPNELEDSSNGVADQGGIASEAYSNDRGRVLALFTVGDVYASLCKQIVYAPFIAQRRRRVQKYKRTQDPRAGTFQMRGV